MFYEYSYQKREIVDSENIDEKLKLYDIPKLDKQDCDLLEGPFNKLKFNNFLKKK